MFLKFFSNLYTYVSVFVIAAAIWAWAMNDILTAEIVFLFHWIFWLIMLWGDKKRSTWQLIHTVLYIVLLIAFLTEDPLTKYFNW